MRSILLQLHIGQPKECIAWSNVPTAHGVQITIYVNGGASSYIERTARNCFSLLERSLATIGGVKGKAPCTVDYGKIFPAYTCAGAVHGLHKRVLIYIADGTATIDPAIEHYFLSPNSVIIPIVDNSLGPDLSKILPPGINTKISERIDNFDVAPVIPRILRTAGVLTTGFRLFISYRHADAKAIAGQLFHALSERMYDVFLDRFSSRTGDDFVSLIKEELFNKSCVLVLETPNLEKSVYCRQEVATATAYRLGLLAVDLPGSKKIFPVITKRLGLETAQLTPTNELSANDLIKLINFIDTNYDHEIARRLRYQDQLLINGIMAAKLNPQLIGIGQYRIQKNGQSYFLKMSSCPPDVTDFIDAESLAQQAPPVNQTMVFGPISVVRTMRANQISWLGKKSAINPIDEGHLERSINQL